MFATNAYDISYHTIWQVEHLPPEDLEDFALDEETFICVIMLTILLTMAAHFLQTFEKQLLEVQKHSFQKLKTINSEIDVDKLEQLYRTLIDRYFLPNTLKTIEEQIGISINNDTKLDKAKLLINGTEKKLDTPVNSPVELLASQIKRLESRTSSCNPSEIGLYDKASNLYVYAESFHGLTVDGNLFLNKNNENDLDQSNQGHQTGDGQVFISKFVGSDETISSDTNSDKESIPVEELFENNRFRDTLDSELSHRGTNKRNAASEQRNKYDSKIFYNRLPGMKRSALCFGFNIERDHSVSLLKKGKDGTIGMKTEDQSKNTPNISNTTTITTKTKFKNKFAKDIQEINSTTSKNKNSKSESKLLLTKSQNIKLNKTVANSRMENEHEKKTLTKSKKFIEQKSKSLQSNIKKIKPNHEKLNNINVECEDETDSKKLGRKQPLETSNIRSSEDITSSDDITNTGSERNTKAEDINGMKDIQGDKRGSHEQKVQEEHQRKKSKNLEIKKRLEEGYNKLPMTNENRKKLYMRKELLQ